MQLLDNYWDAAALTSGEVEETYTSGHPEPSARQMLLTASEIAFLVRKKAFFGKNSRFYK